MTQIVLETPRLILRPPRIEDFEDWAAMGADPDQTRYIGGPQPRDATWRLLAAQAGSWALLGYGLFSIVERSSGRWMGCAGPVRPPNWPGNEVGWRLAAAAEGRGYAGEAASAAMTWVFETLGWTEVIHPIHVDNARSIRLAERLGSVRLGPISMPAPFDSLPVVAWGQTREAWRSRAGDAPAA